jgi:DNA primase
LKASQPYLEYLLDRAAEGQNLATAEGRARLVTDMLPVLARVKDRIRRDLFVESVAGKARVATDVVQAELQKSAHQRPISSSPTQLSSFGQVTKAEKGLIWWLVHQPELAFEALSALDPDDLAWLPTRSVLDLARKLNEDRGFSPSTLHERLSMVEAQLVTEIAAEPEPPVHNADGCTSIIRQLRLERERASIQSEIDRLQRLGAAEHGDEIDALWARKRELIQRIDGLLQ